MPVRFPLVLILLASVALAAPPKKKRKPPPPKPAANVLMEVELKKTLDGAEEKVGGCVLESAGPGAFTLMARAKVTLNSAGQLMGTTVTLVPAETPGADKMRSCIESVLKELTWPRSSAPLINAEREWTFESR